MEKHQWTELFCFLIKNKLIFCKQQQQQLSWTTPTTKSQMPYGLVFIKLDFVREQFYHRNQEGTSHIQVHE